MAIGAIRLNKTERRRVTGPAGSELLARWLNLPRSRSDQRAGQSPEAKNENRPPVLSRRPLPQFRQARGGPHKHTGSSRSSMKMAADRRGWKSRQALSQASTPSHWLARAQHRRRAREDAIVSRYWLLGAWWFSACWFNGLRRLDGRPDRSTPRSRRP